MSEKLLVKPIQPKTLLWAVFYAVAGCGFALVFSFFVAAIPGLLNWFQRFVLSEKYLLLTNGWQLWQAVFPRWGVIQFCLLCFFSVTGFVVVANHCWSYIKKYSYKLPVYESHKQTIMRLTALLLVSFIIGLLLGLFELRLRSDNRVTKLLLGEKLTLPNICRQELCADERGMNMFRQDFVWDDTLKHVNKQGFLSALDYSPAIADSLRRAGKKIVLLIGDSFVEGFIKDNVTKQTWNHTFSELIKKEMRNQYAILSFGISGTDPLDYKLRVEKFIPELKPDLVILCFCHGSSKLN